MYIIDTFDSFVWLTVFIVFVQILKVLNLKIQQIVWFQLLAKWKHAFVCRFG